MSKFFAAGTNLSGGAAILRGEDAGRAKAARVQVGNTLVSCDSAGGKRFRRLTRTGVKGAPEPALRAVICAAMPRDGGRAARIVQTCTEAGAAEILFFFSARGAARPKGRALEKRLLRLQRAAKGAAKECGRGVPPAVGAVPDLAGAISAALKTELPLLMYERGERPALRAVIREAGAFSSCAVLTGPERGFAPHEAELCRAAGLKVCSLGPRVLRCETAPLLALTALLYESGDMD